MHCCLDNTDPDVVVHRDPWHSPSLMNSKGNNCLDRKKLATNSILYFYDNNYIIFCMDE